MSLRSVMCWSLGLFLVACDPVQPLEEPTLAPTESVTPGPDPSPTAQPSPVPTPTEVPVTPTLEPTQAPTPTMAPTPTQAPTPTMAPTPTPEPREDDLYYDPDHLLEIHIEMAPADFEAMRNESRSTYDIFVGEDCLAEPQENPYTWYHGNVTVDGQQVLDVGIRKKGFVGSQSTSKPGMLVDLDQWNEEQTLAGMSRLTLNNSVQDASLIHQCLSYGILRDAGIPASRCNFARVQVNEEYLGIYVHVEPVKKDFLRQHFLDEDGDLYEGSLSDFREGWTGTFDPKTSDTDPEKGPIMALKEALEVPDERLLSAVEAQIDLEAYLTFWAGEVLVGHWDGYDGDANNFFVYRDPDQERMFFIPWGTDGTFTLKKFPGSPMSVYAAAMLPWRLYALPEIQERYVARMLELLQTTWDETWILAEIDRMEALVTPHVDNGETVLEAIDNVRAWVAGRRAELMPELEKGGASWDNPLRDDWCMPEAGVVSATFETTWLALMEGYDGLSTGDSSMTLTWYGEPVALQEGGAAIGTAEGMAELVVSAPLSKSTHYRASLSFPLEWATPGTYPIDGDHAIGSLATVDTRSGRASTIGLILGGDITFTAVDDVPGAAVVGSFSSVVYDSQ